MENTNVTDFVECKNCKLFYECVFSYLGGCTNGIKFIGENTMKNLELFKEMKLAWEKFDKAYLEFWKNEHENETTYKNTKMIFWREICLKYDEKDLLNCYGDIFFIVEKNANYYIGRRILWNLELSEEKYEITAVTEKDDDDIEYDFSYDIKVLVDED
jgi:hypothetical protein